MQFIRFDQISEPQNTLIVDGKHANKLLLSHWKGANIYPDIADDTSAGIVLNALRKNVSWLDKAYVSATHYDIDGFIGVWALQNPKLALQYENLLKEVAVIGDFRELNFDNPVGNQALKLVCWLNQIEKKLFYVPFGAEETEEKEMILCQQKFDYFLDAFEDVLLHTDAYQEDWETEYQQVKEAYNQIHNTEITSIKTFPEIGLIVIQTPHPVHYYALFSITKGFDMVLSIYNQQRYELEYKYTTWVDITSRLTLPRLDLKDLIAQLQPLEKSTLQWHFDGVTDTGPVLRLENANLSKAERFANPTERNIYSSIILPEILEEIVVQFFSKKYQSISPKKHWTWEETRKFNTLQNASNPYD